MITEEHMQKMDLRIRKLAARVAELEQMVETQDAIIGNLKGLTIARPTYTPPQKAGFLSGLFK